MRFSVKPLQFLPFTIIFTVSPADITFSDQYASSRVQSFAIVNLSLHAPSRHISLPIHSIGLQIESQPLVLSIVQLFLIQVSLL